MLDLLTQSAFWGLLFLIGGAGLSGLYAYGLVRYSARLRTEGVDGQAAVERLQTRTRSIYFQSGIKFAFPVDYALVSYTDPRGRTRRAEIEISVEFARTLTTGAAIPIRYLPTSPGIMEIEPGRHAQDARLMQVVAAIFLFAAILLAVGSVNWAA